MTSFWDSGLISGAVGAVLGSIAGYFFTKRLNKTNVTLELVKHFMGQNADGSALERCLRESDLGAKILSPEVIDRTLMFGGWYNVVSRACLERKADRSMLESMSVWSMFSRFHRLVVSLGQSNAELQGAVASWTDLAKYVEEPWVEPRGIRRFIGYLRFWTS